LPILEVPTAPHISILRPGSQPQHIFTIPILG